MFRGSGTSVHGKCGTAVEATLSAVGTGEGIGLPTVPRTPGRAVGSVAEVPEETAVLTVTQRAPEIARSLAIAAALAAGPGR
ncbi:hypothetical protein MTO96_046818 [Rhipicephalus appendiculatus]